MAEKIKQETTPQDDGYVTIYVPRKGKEDQFMVGFNFKNYMLKRGEYVRVPKGVQEVIMNSEYAEEFANAYARQKETDYLKKAANPIALD